MPQKLHSLKRLFDTNPQLSVLFIAEAPPSGSIQPPFLLRGLRDGDTLFLEMMKRCNEILPD
jgi:hypothetical protein